MIKALSTLSALLASLLLVGLTGLILIEIVGRGLFDYSTMIADEYSGYLYLAIVFLGLAYTFCEEGHIRIKLVAVRLDRKKNRYIDISVSAVLFVILAYALYYSYLMMMDAKEMDMVSEAVSETPIYLTQIPLMVGLSVFLLSVLGFMYKRIRYVR